MFGGNIGKEIQRLVNGCKDHQESKPTQRREPLIATPLPNHPWERVRADLCEVNKQHLLIVVDYFTRYVEIAHLPDLCADWKTCLHIGEIQISLSQITDLSLLEKHSNSLKETMISNMLPQVHIIPKLPVKPKGQYRQQRRS